MEKDKNELAKARQILDDFADRTGIPGEGGNTQKRYLWTDAFAVQAFFGLSHIYPESNYRELALRLIKEVHKYLGRYRPDDDREGWISGLSEKKGQQHPTIGGLRIGKQLPERKDDEDFNHRLEWERDGQYFHYLTRWGNALLQAAKETGEERYASWAAELCEAGAKFVDKTNGIINMYWKMNTDLSEALVESMGAHDPMEGYICTQSARMHAPEKSAGLAGIAKDFEVLCAGMKWDTSDALGIGGLLLNTARAAEMTLHGQALPDSLRPDKLFKESLKSLNIYAATIHDPQADAQRRLAFRECGLSLGINVLGGLKEKYRRLDLPLDEVDNFLPMAREIEQFWLHAENRLASSWSDHPDINAVTLGCSIIAREQPAVFALA